MATFILHLSDLHLSDKAPDCSALCDAVAKALNRNDNLIICFTGDMTFKCEKRSFQNVKILLRKIIDKLSESIDSKIQCFLVPGNHDINIANRKYSNITKAINSNDKKQIAFLFDNDLSLCSDSLALCNEFNCFVNSKLLDYKSLNIDGLKCNFIILNTAPFSSISHEDKDFHYLPENIVWPSLPKDDTDQISIFLSHHRPDWFEEKSSKNLKKYLVDKISIFIHGHDHDIEAASISFISGEILSISGGELFVDISNNLSGQFNVIRINNVKDKSIEYFSYRYSSEYGKFLSEHKKNFSYVNKLELRRVLPTFETNLFKSNDYSIDLDLRNVFVMPYLESLSEENDPINSFQELCDFLLKNHQMYVCGQSGQGKTFLAKSMFNYFKNTKWCIYMDPLSLNANNMELSIKDAFCKQYGNDSDLFSIFNDSPKNEKMIILDGIEAIDTTTKLINFKETCDSKFGYVFITGLSFSEKLINEVDYFIYNTYFAFRSLGFTIKQRENLIVKICSEKGIVDDFTIKKIVSTVFGSLALSSSADLTSPLLLSTLTLAVIDKKMYIDRQTSDSFSAIFEFNILSALSRFGDKDDLSKYSLILSQTAYKVFKRHKDIYFDAKFICDSFSEVKLEHNFVNLDFSKTLNIFLKSNILVKNDKDSYKFCKNSYLSYFAAKRISVLTKNGNRDDVEEIVNNISYGINSDILLFLIYILKELPIIELVVNKLDSFLKDIKEIDFDTKNNNILKRENNYLPETKEQAETRTQLIQRLDLNESRKIRKIKDREEKVFAEKDYDQLIDNLLKTSKLIEIVSRAISGFDEEINDSKRKKMLDVVLSSVLKIIYVSYDFDKELNTFVEKQFNNQVALSIKRLEEMGGKDDLIKRIKSMSFVDYMYSKITTSTLNCLTNIASVAGSETSLPSFDKIVDKKFCYLLFKLVAYERFGKFDRFCATLKKFYDSKKKCDLKIVNRVIRMYAITKGLTNSQIAQISNITGFSKERLLNFCHSFILSTKDNK